MAAMELTKAPGPQSRMKDPLLFNSRSYSKSCCIMVLFQSSAGAALGRICPQAPGHSLPSPTWDSGQDMKTSSFTGL